MIPLSLRALASACGADLRGLDLPTADESVVTGLVSTDSREIGPGSLFVARLGEFADGHDFVPAALAAGAVGALTSRPIPGAPCLVVKDTEVAFGQIGRAVVDAGSDLMVVGVTGSSGKTSTKDLLGQVLAHLGPTVAPEGSYNSEIGVPLTVCRITPDTRFLVVEMGARGIGHIAHLTTIAPPRIGVVLNVGTAHVGEFGSIANIARAKCELVRALPPDGVAVLNADDPAVRAMAAATGARVVLVGEAEDADVRAEALTLDGSGRPSFVVAAGGARVPVTLSLVGRHHVANALAVIAVALECRMPLADVTRALADAGPVSRWRMEVTTRPDGVVIVNDAYNANPDSMLAALDAAAAMDCSGRRWAVLGPMLELGEESEAGHAAVGVAAIDRGIDELLVVGDLAAPMAVAAQGSRSARGRGDGAPPGDGEVRGIRQVRDADAARTILDRELAPGDVVLFKSSRDAGLRWLGDIVSGVTEERS